MFGIGRFEAYALGTVLLVIVAAAAGGWCYHHGRMAERHEWEVKQAEAVGKDFKSLQEAVDQNLALAKGTASAVAGIKVTHITTKGVLEREIATNTIYSNDCMPATGIMRWNDISAGRPIVPSGTAGQQPNGGGTELPKGNDKADTGRKGWNPLAQPRGKP